MAWYAELLANWESLTAEPVAIEELGGDRVLVEEAWRARGVRSGVEVDMRAAALFTIRDGRVAVVRYFRSLDAAREAASRDA